jgi:tetratricopeptide (TPR) repeat protein
MANQIEAYNHLKLGNTFYDQGNYIEACKEYQKSAEQDPDYADAYYGWGLSLRNQKNYDEAIEKYKKAIEINSNYADAYYGRGLAYYYKGNYDLAIADYDQTIKHNPDYADAYYNWGVVLANQKNYDEAIEKFQEAIQANNNYAYAYHNIAHYLWRQGKYKASLEEWEKACKAYEQTKEKAKDSKNGDHFLYYGGVLHQVFGELNKAEEIYKEGLRLNPYHIGILTSLVNLYLEKNDENTNERTMAYWKAQEAYNKAEGILKDQLKKAENAGTFLQLGKLQLTMLTTKEEYAEAEKNLRNALDGYKESAAPYTDLGVLYTRKENFKKAIEYFESAHKRDPDDLTVWSNIAETYFKLEKVEKAEAEYGKILSITPYHIESHIGLGEVYTAMGDNDGDMYNQAIWHFTEAIRIAQSKNGSKRLKKKELASIFYSRGYARVKLYETSTIRDKDENLLHYALEDFKKCFDNDRDHNKARRAKEKLEKRLSRFSQQLLTEKIGPWIISGLSLIVFIITQGSFFYGKPLFLYGPNKSITEGHYELLSLGSLIYMVAGLYLPHILKLKVAGIELEKSSVDQITTPTTFGISK